LNELFSKQWASAPSERSEVERERGKKSVFLSQVFQLYPSIIFEQFVNDMFKQFPAEHFVQTE